MREQPVSDKDWNLLESFHESKWNFACQFHTHFPPLGNWLQPTPRPCKPYGDILHRSGVGQVGWGGYSWKGNGPKVSSSHRACFRIPPRDMMRVLPRLVALFSPPDKPPLVTQGVFHENPLSPHKVKLPPHTNAFWIKLFWIKIIFNLGDVCVTIVLYCWHTGC